MPQLRYRYDRCAKTPADVPDRGHSPIGSLLLEIGCLGRSWGPLGVEVSIDVPCESRSARAAH